MGRKALVLILSIVASFGLMSGGYGKWSREVTITGEVDVIPNPKVISEMESQLSNLEGRLIDEMELYRIAEELRIEEEKRLIEEQKAVNNATKAAEKSSEPDNVYEDDNQDEDSNKALELDENAKEALEIDYYDIEKGDALEDTDSVDSSESRFDIIGNLND